MSHHLGYAPVTTGEGMVRIDVLRDRHCSFEPETHYGAALRRRVASAL